ncbi:hypothetical protein ACOMHN_049247 [Nucella lapillus]
MINFLLVLTISASASSIPSLEFEDHIKRIIRSDEIDGYDFATVHAINDASTRETGQTKRDIESYAAHPSPEKRSFSLLLSSGQRLRMSLARRSVDTSGTIFTELTEEGEREISLRQPRDCFFGGELEGEEGFASLGMCDGELTGAISTAKRTYEIHALHQPMEKRYDDDVMKVLVTWQEGQERERELDDGLEIPDDYIPIPDDYNGDNATEEIIKWAVADRKLTIEIIDYVDSFYIQEIGEKLGKTTDQQITDYLLLKWTKVQQALSNKNLIGWDITLKLNELHLWRTNPATGFYHISPSDKIGARMNKICQGTMDKEADHITLHTARTSDPGRLGLAWLGGMCRPRYRCSAVRAIGIGANTELHELGHIMGLNHDGKMQGCIEEGKGFMRYSYTFLHCYRKHLEDFFTRNDKKCAFTDTNGSTPADDHQSLVINDNMRSCFLMINFLLVLTTSASVFSLPSLEFEDHIKRIIGSDDIDGYDVATVYAVNGATNKETGQTKRDIESYAAHPSPEKRSFSLLLSSGQRLRMSLARRSVDTSGTIFTELTEEGEREISIRQPRDCFFGGKLEGEEGFASLGMCDGELTGAINTAKRTYEIHALHHPMEKRSDDDVMKVLVTWQEGQEREQELDDGIEIPDDYIPIPDDDNATEGASRRTVADRKLTIEIGDIVDRYHIQELAKKLGKQTDRQIIDHILLKWSKVHQALSSRKQVGRDITLKLVHVKLWRTDPSFYKVSPSDTITDRLNKICNAPLNEKYDQITLHTARTADPIRIGVAWVAGLCRPKYRCAAVRSLKASSNTELHELGHNMGLKHDKDIPGCSSEGQGFMGYSFTFLNCYRKPLYNYFSQGLLGHQCRQDQRRARTTRPGITCHLSIRIQSSRQANHIA